MKFTLKQLTIFAALAMGAAACSDNDPDNTITVDAAMTEIAYDEDGVWADCLNPEAAYIDCQGVRFSHFAETSPYGTYWYGFCPSRNSDNADYSDGNWLDHQWTAMPGGSTSGKGTPYIIAYWNTIDNPAEGDASLRISLADGGEFNPVHVYFTNTTYGYYAMANGTAWSKKFADGDWCKIVVRGIYADGSLTEPLEFYLADFRDGASKIVDGWTLCNLSSLAAEGPLTAICMTMESSDTGMWGMNNPAYFAIDRLKIEKL